MKNFFILFLIILSPLAANAASDTKAVKLQILNKINAKTVEKIVYLDKKTIVQDLEIKLNSSLRSK